MSDSKRPDKIKLKFKVMKTRSIQISVMVLIISVLSCNEPRTVLTDIVHPDGSVTRRIEIKSSEKKFNVSDLQIPFDETWAIKDSIEIGKNGDTTYVRRAEKLFENVSLLNETYLNDKSANRVVKRHAGFIKRFRWFNTEYRFEEAVDKTLKYGYPVSDFLDTKELDYYFSPGRLNDERKMSSDSLMYRALEDTINKKTDVWTIKNAVAEWIGLFSALIVEKGGNDMTYESLKAKEDYFVKIVKENENKFDSLWGTGQILKEFLGEQNAARYKTDADSAMNMMEKALFVDFKEYSQCIAMPGKLIGTNGFRDSTQMLLWPVKSDYFVSEPYIMWAESKTTNTWAWIVTGIFMLFVLAGMILKMIRK
jgi:hypothetical protein